MLRKTVLFLLFSTFSLFAKPADLSSKDVQNLSHEILKNHVLYQKITPEIAERILKNYLTELDPAKTYLIESEVQEWLYPSEDVNLKVMESFKEGDFTLFFTIHEKMADAINRRQDLEPKVTITQNVKDSDNEYLKEDKWPVSQQELVERISKIYSLQLDSFEKIGCSTKEECTQFLQKRRKNRESKILGADENERVAYVHAAILKAMASSLDMHTNYFTPSEAKQFMIQVEQRLFGIGAQLRDTMNGYVVVHIVEDSPADKGKQLKLNDKIIAVDQEPIVGLDLAEGVEKIRGKKGSAVQLTIVREIKNQKPETLDIEIVRGEIILEESRLQTSYEPFADGVIAHFHLLSFYQDPKSSSAKDIYEAYENIQKKHPIKGVVLDLRNNGGGLLPQAVEVTGLFISKGIVASIKDNTGKVQHLRDTNDKIMFEGPLVVLINKASASAAEIVAQTLKDYGRAIIVGDETSYGKGSFQSTSMSNNSSKINPKGEYKITRGLYYTVSGKSPQLTGVKSDIVVPGILSEIEIGERYGQYPLENNSIKENFEDDLEDVPSIHRKRIESLYKHNLQKRLTTYKAYLPLLKENSQERLKQNTTYQTFLEEIKKKNFEAEIIETFGKNDLQLIETYNITKDLIFLMQCSQKVCANY